MVAVRDVDRRVLRVHVAEEVGELGFGAGSAIRPDSLQRAGALQANFPFKDLVEIILISQRMHKIQLSVSFSLECELKSVVATDSRSQLYLSFLMARTTCHMTRFPVS